MNKSAGRGGINVVLLTAQCVKVPSGLVVSVILVATQHGCISGAAQSKMNARYGLGLTNKQPNNEMAAFEIKLREAPLPRTTE